MPRTLNCSCDEGNKVQEEGKYNYDLCWAEFARRKNLQMIIWDVYTCGRTNDHDSHSHVRLTNMYSETQGVWTQVDAYDAGEAMAMILSREERAYLESEAVVGQNKRAYGRKIQFE